MTLDVNAVQARLAAGLAWTDGHPQHAGLYWCEMEDMGGWPSVRPVIVALRWKPNKDNLEFIYDSKRLAQKSLSVAEFNEKYLVLQYSVVDTDSGDKHWENLAQLIAHGNRKTL